MGALSVRWLGEPGARDGDGLVQRAAKLRLGLEDGVCPNFLEQAGARQLPVYLGADAHQHEAAAVGMQHGRVALQHIEESAAQLFLAAQAQDDHGLVRVADFGQLLLQERRSAEKEAAIGIEEGHGAAGQRGRRRLLDREAFGN